MKKKESDLQLNIKLKNRIIQLLPILVLLVITLVVSLNLTSNPFSERLPRHDSSMFTYFGFAMNKGQIMYKDIFDHKGPLIFFLNYLGVVLSINQFAGVYLIEILCIFLFFYFSFKTAKLWLPSLLALIPIGVQAVILSLFLEGGNFTEEYALPFISFSLYCFIKFYKNNKQITALEIFFISLSMGAVFLLRPNMIIVWAVFCLIIFIDLLINKNYQFLLKIITLFFGGLLTAIFPFIIYLGKEGALSQAIFQSLTFNFKYLDSISGREEGIVKLLETISSNYILILGAYLLISFVYRRKKLTGNDKYIYLGSVLSLCLSFIASAMSGRNYTHYLMIILPTLTIPITLLLKDFSFKVKQNSLFFMSATFLVIVYFHQIYISYNYIYETNIVAADYSDEMNIREKRSLALEKEVNTIKEVANVIKENTVETDKIYAHRTGGNLYLLSKRLSSVKYFNLPAVNINENEVIGKDFFNEIKAANTKIIILRSAFADQEKIGVEKEFYNFVNSNYHEIYSENGYNIYSEN